MACSLKKPSSLARSNEKRGLGRNQARKFLTSSVGYRRPEIGLSVAKQQNCGLSVENQWNEVRPYSTQVGGELGAHAITKVGILHEFARGCPRWYGAVA
jgi:hypothetical protein